MKTKTTLRLIFAATAAVALSSCVDNYGGGPGYVEGYGGGGYGGGGYAPGYVVNTLPGGYEPIYYGGEHYYVSNGVFYRPRGRGYVVVERPHGYTGHGYGNGPRPGGWNGNGPRPYPGNGGWNGSGPRPNPGNGGWNGGGTPRPNPGNGGWNGGGTPRPNPGSGGWNGGNAGGGIPRPNPGNPGSGGWAGGGVPRPNPGNPGGVPVVRPGAGVGGRPAVYTQSNRTPGNAPKKYVKPGEQ